MQTESSANQQAQRDYVNTSSWVFSLFLKCTALFLLICCSLDDGSEKHGKCHFL